MALPGNSRDEIFLSNCAVTLGGESVGFTSGPVKITVAMNNDVIETEQYDGPIEIFTQVKSVEVELPIAQFDIELLQAVLSGVTVSGDTFGIGGTTPRRMSDQALAMVITPNNTNIKAYTIPLAVPTAESIDLILSRTGADNKHCPLGVKFQALADTTQAAGFQLIKYNATADTTAPTATYSPLEDATGVAVDSNLVATFSKALATRTVNSGTVALYTLAGVAPIAGTVTLVNNGASTTVTFNPTSNLDASTEYEWILTQGIKDPAGNAFAGVKVHFTTA